MDGAMTKDREYPDHPIVGVGAVVVVKGKVLLAQRGSEPGYGTWSIPGGIVELGETVRDAVVREVREETNLDVEPGPVIEVLDRIIFDSQGRPRYHYVLVDFLCTAVNGTPRAGSDTLAIRLLDEDEVGAMEELHPDTRRVIQKGFRLAAGGTGHP